MMKKRLSPLANAISPFGEFTDLHQGSQRELMIRRDHVLEILKDLEDRIREQAPGLDARWATWQELCK